MSVYASKGKPEEPLQESQAPDFKALVYAMLALGMYSKEDTDTQTVIVKDVAPRTSPPFLTALHQAFKKPFQWEKIVIFPVGADIHITLTENIPF